MSSITKENGSIIPKSRLQQLLETGIFTVTAELASPDSAEPNDVYERAEMLNGYVDAINATDGSGANCHMSSVGVCSILTRRGYNMIMQIACRDRNRIAIQGDVLGAAAMGVENILCLTGDGVERGNHPQAKPVFDLDSISLLNTIRKMRDEGKYLNGHQIHVPPRIFLGAAANPFAPPLDFRPLRLGKKVNAGAQFIQTQYCFDIEMFKNYMNSVRELGLDSRAYIIPGVGPLASARTAEWIRSNVAGVHIPDHIINRLNSAKDQKQEGINICIELIEQIREMAGISGIHIMAYKQEDRIAEIVEKSGVFKNRIKPTKATASI